jgi:predicted dehydrogenase
LVAFEHGYVRLCPAPSLAVNRAGRIEIYTDADGALPQRVAPELPWIDPQQAQAANFLRVCRGEAPPPTDAVEAAEDLRLVADIVRARVALPGAREALRADREERIRAWEQRRSAR